MPFLGKLWCYAAFDVVEERAFAEGGDVDPATSLEGVRSSMRREWAGALLSRVVGTRAPAAAAGDQAAPGAVVLRRTKRDGGVERPIPLPFPLVVVARDSPAPGRPGRGPRGDRGAGGRGRRYLPSLAESLRIATVGPAPIRGYDWRGPMGRGEVVEEAVGGPGRDGGGAARGEGARAGPARAGTPGERAAGGAHPSRGGVREREPSGEGGAEGGADGDGDGRGEMPAAGGGGRGAGTPGERAAGENGHRAAAAAAPSRSATRRRAARRPREAPTGTGTGGGMRRRRWPGAAGGRGAGTPGERAASDEGEE